MVSGRSRTIGNPLSKKHQQAGNPLVLVLGIAMTLVVFVVCIAYVFFLSTVLQGNSQLKNHLNIPPSSVSTKQKSIHHDIPHQPENASFQHKNLDVIQKVKTEFHQRYGTSIKDINSSSTLLEAGTRRIGSIDETAQRFLHAQHMGRNIVMGFGGYSVTVGRGNYFSQSYPFVLQRILEPVLQATLNIGITVRNGAIGGIPSFPYAFCFEHFLGKDLDVVSWDYSLNEGKGAALMESYVRQTQHQLDNQPMIITLDTNQKRCDLLEGYAEKNWIRDGICVDQGKAIPKDILALDSDKRPPGFQHWEEFGAPAGCPGRGSWHPKKMEHELIGWLMAMYFLEAIERATQLSYHPPASTSSKLLFDAPLSSVPDNPPEVTDLLYGHKDTSTGIYLFKELSCRTNFLPATDEEKVLPSIVVSGLANGITSDNIMETRSDDAYESGWVLDVSKIERETKEKVEKCGGLGYVDMKIALYGIPQSGPLRLWLPLEKELERHDKHDHVKETSAQHWFDDLIICEANEKRPDSACQLDSDIEFTVGGAKVSSTTMIAGAGEYLKRKTCVNVGVPPGAKITRLGDLKQFDGESVDGSTKTRLSNDGLYGDDHVGLVVDIKVDSRVTRKAGACCISHVVWEQH